MNKHILTSLAVFTLGVTTLKANWFDQAEKERRLEIQQQFTQQQHETSQWQGLAFALGIGSMLMLITGTIIGSRTRRHATKTSK